VSGSCTDNAGKTVSATSRVFRYASPPRLTAHSDPADGIVVLHWTISDIASPRIKILRTPGYGRSGASVVYRGDSGVYRDRRVRNGVRYRYTLVATDTAGNKTVHTLWATAGPHLIAPAQGTRINLPPLLLWTPVRSADYYNVQLFRGKTEVLSVWPRSPSVQLQSAWRFNGHRYQLKPGSYQWYVWPGFGPQGASNYGPEIGSGTFVVVGHA